MNKEPQSTEKNLFWIHCYKCFELFLKKKRQFFLCECRHIICGLCLKRVDQKKAVCPICVKPNGFLLIENSMPKQFRMLFHPNPTSFKYIDWKIVLFQNDAQKHFSLGMLKMKVFLEQYKKNLIRSKMYAKKRYQYYKMLRGQRREEEQHYNSMVSGNNQSYAFNSTSGLGTLNGSNDFTL
ncbi:hypothetical protein ACFFRR_004148 [Megaselia abdita]